MKSFLEKIKDIALELESTLGDVYDTSLEKVLERYYEALDIINEEVEIMADFEEENQACSLCGERFVHLKDDEGEGIAATCQC